MIRRIWVACIITDEYGRVLLSRRQQDTFGDLGKFGPPGGHVERGETILDAAHRECQEETGQQLHDSKLVGFWDCCGDGIAFFVTGRISFAPQNIEPEKHGPWSYFAMNNMPNRAARYIQGGILAYMRGDFVRVAS